MSKDGQLTLRQELTSTGLVNGAVLSDLDDDGYPELVLACEWGPIRVYHNERGEFHEVTRSLGVENQSGWWTGVTTGDLDGDGKLDMIAGNWGANTVYEAERSEPLRLYYGDFNQDSTTQMMESFYSPRLGKVVPRRGLDPLAQAMPWLRERFGSYATFSSAGVEEILGERLKSARQCTATTLESVVAFNRGDHFEVKPLPVEAQWSPVFGVCVGDLDGDGSEDVFRSQNFFAVEPGSPRYDGGRGLWLKGDGRGGLSAVPGNASGIKVYGEQRGAALCDYDEDGRVDVAVSQNGAETKLYRNLQARPGIRVKLHGPAGNPSGIGAQLRVLQGTKRGPVREIHGGSGYWSQDSPVQVFSVTEPLSGIEIRWPGGRWIRYNISSAAREVTLEYRESSEPN